MIEGKHMLPLGKYRHYKGNDYEVVGVATHSETKEKLVVYRALYAEFGLWVRPLAMFTEDVEVGGVRMPRFAYVGGETAQTVFAYGTLNDPAVQREVWGRVTPGTADSLAGYALSTIDTPDGRYPLAVPQEGSELPGFVLTVTPAELALIDEYETSAYRREKLTLQSDNEAWVYLKA